MLYAFLSSVGGGAIVLVELATAPRTYAIGAPNTESELVLAAYTIAASTRNARTPPKTGSCHLKELSSFLLVIVPYFITGSEDEGYQHFRPLHVVRILVWELIEHDLLLRFRAVHKINKGKDEGHDPPRNDERRPDHAEDHAGVDRVAHILIR